MLVDIPFKMDLGQILDNENYRNYELCGIINHEGTIEKGHYVAYCKNRIYKKWFEFDDELVKMIPKNRVCSRNAYILFYITDDNN